MATPPYSYTDRSHLPTDVEELKNIIEYQWEEFKHYKQQKDLLIQQLMQKIESLEQELAALKRNRLGQRPEKSKKGSNQNHPGRKALPSHLKRVCIEHDLKAEEKRCPECESLLTKIKDIITEQLDMILAQLIVKEHVRARYACRKCYSTIRVADMPAQSIDKRITSSELLAHLIIEKFDYYLPCYRLEKWFARQGVNISRSTIWGWFFKCGLLLESLVEAMHQRELLIGGHLFSDDTTMPTLDPGTGKTKVGRIWIYTQKATKNHERITVYQYTPSREGKYLEAFLKGFKGYLQVDAYQGSIVRRKFMDIIKKVYPDSIAQEMEDMIGKIYDVERIATALNVSSRTTVA